MFPHIKSLDDLLPHIGHNPQIRVKHESTGHIVVCYMLQDEDTFDEDHSSFLYARECRGITFHPDKSIAGRCLTKFFNVGERETTLPENLDWMNVTRIMTKRDGSMVTPVLVNTQIGTWRMKTKKSFDTKEADLALTVAMNTEGGNRWIQRMLFAGLTPTFEITSPKFPIVLIYEKDELTLLHVRENVSGRYLDEDELIALRSPFPLVENIIEQFMEETMVMGCFDRAVSWDKLKHYAETTEGVEGVVIQFGQDMVKLKTKWYCDLHHSVTFTRWRDIARTVLADQSDDLKGAFALTGRSIEPILEVEHKINGIIAAAEKAVDEHVGNGRVLNRTPKDMALAFKDHALFGQIMAAFRGKTVDWREWYEKNYLDTWSLEVV